MIAYKRLIICLSMFSYSLSATEVEGEINAQQPLHILFVVAYFPAPSQTYILNMMTGLIDRGHKVSIFAFGKNDVEGHPHIEKYSLMNSVIYEQLPEELPEYDIVFCQNGSLGKKIAENPVLSEWLSTRKLVVCLRGADITGNVKNNPTIYDTLLRKADLFLPVCDYFKQRLIALGCDVDKVIVHHSAIDCTQFFFKKRKKPKKSTIHLVSVCRLIKKKGIDNAIEAVASVVKKYPNIHFTIVGEGGERKYLERLIKTLNIADKVTLFGWAMQDKVIALLNKSHIFLLPSITAINGDEEGIANALKEAMAMGLISIGTWSAGTPELIEDGVSGFLVPQKDSKQLAKTIEYIIEHPEMWEAMQVAARKKVEEEFETHKSIKELEKIFYQLLE